jgi:hypothetical protein
VPSRMAGDSLTATVVAPRRGEEAHRGAIMPGMRRVAVALLGLPRRLRRGREVAVPSPGGAAPAHGHEPRLRPRRRHPAAVHVRRRQGAPGAPLRRSAGRRGRAGARRRRPRRGRLRALDGLRAAGPTRARWGRPACPPARARARTRPAPPAGPRPARPAARTATSFRLYWLKTASGLDAGAKPDDVIAAVRESAGGSGLLVAATSAAEGRGAALRSRSTSAAVSRRWRPAAEVAQAQRPEGDAAQLDDAVADGLAHPPHLALVDPRDRHSSSCGPSRRTWAGAVRPVVELDAGAQRAQGPFAPGARPRAPDRSAGPRSAGASACRPGRSRRW